MIILCNMETLKNTNIWSQAIKNCRDVFQPHRNIRVLTELLGYEISTRKTNTDNILSLINLKT